VDFNDDVRLDPGQVSDARGRRMSPGLALGGGGGVLGLIVMLVLTLGGVDIGGGSSGAGVQSGPIPESDLNQRCRTGADAEKYADCRIVGIVNSVQAYWTRALPRYQEARTQIFTGATSTACGNATSAVGPFYCPADQGVYLDLGFFETLRDDLGASGGEFAQAYVVAHEYGHHVQNLLGTSDRVRSRDTGADSAAVRLELQADCYAGVWAANAVRTGYISRLTEQDIADGLSAASAVGDDRIQEKARGRVDPESWTHGSAAQRQRWFLRGYDTGRPDRCDTFAAERL
jgi:hypothetical protein